MAWRNIYKTVILDWCWENKWFQNSECFRPPKCLPCFLDSCSLAVAWADTYGQVQCKNQSWLNSWLPIQEANSELTEQWWEPSVFSRSSGVGKMGSFQRKSPGRSVLRSSWNKEQGWMKFEGRVLMLFETFSVPDVLHTHGPIMLTEVLK